MLSSENERGQGLAAAVLMVFAVLISAAIAVDLGYALVERTRQASALSEAEAKCMLPACATAVKNSDEPGHEMCERLVGYLRDSGFEGEIDAYFYEPSRAESGVGEDKRVYVYGAKLKGQTPTVFGKAANIEVPPTETLRWSNAQTYASEKTYRPTTPDNGVYHVEEGATSGTWTAVAGPYEAVMPGVGAEVAFALTKL